MGSCRGQAGFYARAQVTPRDESGSNDMAASPTASQPGPVMVSRRELRAGTTRNPFPGETWPMCDIVCGARSRHRLQNVLREPGATGSMPASVISAATCRPSGRSAEYHHPQSVASTERSPVGGIAVRFADGACPMADEAVKCDSSASKPRAAGRAAGGVYQG